MERQEMLKWKKAAWQKLMGAIAMLLVASIMMSATSYAWFVLSTAPEVTDLTTTAGANGALEIALQSNKADGTGRADILSGVGQSIAGKDAQTANTYWGNVVDLSKGYGLEHITLYPARLNLNGSEVNGEKVYSVATNSMLSVPRFGTDGRLVALDNSKRANFSTDGNKFVSGGSNWGVNVWGAVSEDLGTASQKTLTYSRNGVLQEAREKVANYRASLRETMTQTIEKNSLGIVGLMVTFVPTLPDVEETVYYAAVQNYINVMDSVVTDATDALRWALMANAAADNEKYDSANPEDMKALGSLYAAVVTMPLTGDNSIYSVATANGYTEIADAAQSMAVAVSRVAKAQGLIEKKDITGAGFQLIVMNQTFMYGQHIKNKDAVVSFQDGYAYDLTTDVNRITADNTLGLATEDTIFTVAGTNANETNLFSAIATVIGDYSGEMNVWLTCEEREIENEFGDPVTEEIYAWVGEEPTGEGITSSTKITYTIEATNGSTYSDWTDVDNIQNADGSYLTTQRIGTLGNVSKQIAGINATGDILYVITRSDVSAYGYSVDLAFQSSQATNLMLQQKGIVRVSSDDSGTETVNAATQGGGSTVEFIIPGDKTEEQITKLLQGIHVVFMNTGTGTIYKIAAIDSASVEFTWTADPARKVTATLALYEPVFSQDGVMSLGTKSTDQVITALSADTPYYITTVVYLNGDQVDSTMFSAQGLSLDGKVNLQFASSATLEAMDYQFVQP